ncbi:MAG: hypothetical protein ACE14P_11790 [Methanotrichaceae archaeon]
MKIRPLQKLGGIGQFILVPFRIKRGVTADRIKFGIIHTGLIVLLLASMIEGCTAELPQNSIAVADHSMGIAIEDASANHGHMPPSDGDTAETSSTLGFFNPLTIQPPSLMDLQPFGPAAPNNIAPKPSEGDIVIQLFDGRGFALKDSEKNALMINIDLIKDVDPTYLRNLMTSKKSIEDIKDELRAADGTTATRGSLGINERIYPLVNIELLPSKDNSTIVDADVAKLYLKPDGTIDKVIIAGHIKVAVTPTPDGLIGNGELAMSSDEYNGIYTVLLHMEKPLPGNIPPAWGNLTMPKLKR